MSYDSNKEIPQTRQNMVRAETLASEKNPLLKDIRRAITRGSLTEGGLCVAETFHLVDEALASGREIAAVLVAESARPRMEPYTPRLASARLLRLTDALFRQISATESAQGVMALVRPPSWTLDQLFTRPALLLVLDAVQDPGNLGTAIRAAEAFGATGVIAIKGSANPYNPKAVRASAGSIFRIPLVPGLDAALAQTALHHRHLEICAAMPEAGQPPAAVDLTGDVALVVGSEGHGVGPCLRQDAARLRIPTLGVESLNAAMAAGILLYEARRQRSQAA